MKSESRERRRIGRDKIRGVIGVVTRRSRRIEEIADLTMSLDFKGEVIAPVVNAIRNQNVSFRLRRVALWRILIMVCNIYNYSHRVTYTSDAKGPCAKTPGCKTLALRALCVKVAA